MCLAALALNAHPRFPLVIAANRDEFFARAAAPLAWWPDAEVLAGRDLSAGGTWFGLSRAGRLALLTNVREPGRQLPDAPSRGALVLDWLNSGLSATAFAEALDAQAYNGFNLIVADLARGNWRGISNRAPAVELAPGIHAVSNAALDTPWPKTTGLQAALAAALAGAESAERLTSMLLEALADPTEAPDEALPDTGVGLVRERLLSPRFVRMPDPARPEMAVYGTRSSTVLVCELSGGRRRTRVVERSVEPDGATSAAVEHLLPDWPG